MRHRRSIDLAAGTALPAADIRMIGECAELPWLTCAKLAPEYSLGCKCTSCGHVAWLDRWKLSLRFGEHALIDNLRHRLRCSLCGNHRRNGFVLGKSTLRRLPS